MDITEILTLLTSLFLLSPSVLASYDVSMQKKWLNRFNNNSLIAPNVSKEKHYFVNIDFKDKEILIPYIEILKNKISPANLENLYENMKDLLIIKEKKSLFKTYIGTYGPMENELSYCQKKAISHELLHLASSEYNLETDISYCGFSQYLTDIANIGYSLNEGYTELLNWRYFLNNAKPKKYKNLVQIDLLVEKLVGEEHMTNLFFHHDLPGLVESLSSYSNSKNIENLIFTIDKYGTFSNHISPISLLYLAKIEFSLYNLYISKVTDPKKIKEFEDIINDNKLFSLLFSLKRKDISKKDLEDIVKENSSKNKVFHK